jgi:hypothetical protein
MVVARECAPVRTSRWENVIRPFWNVKLFHARGLSITQLSMSDFLILSSYWAHTMGRTPRFQFKTPSFNQWSVCIPNERLLFVNITPSERRALTFTIEGVRGSESCETTAGVCSRCDFGRLQKILYYFWPLHDVVICLRRTGILTNWSTAPVFVGLNFEDRLRSVWVVWYRRECIHEDLRSFPKACNV